MSCSLCVTTALPVIVEDLHGQEFEWVGSAYALSATAFQPLMGGLAQVCACSFLSFVLLIRSLGFRTADRDAAPNITVCHRKRNVWSSTFS